MLLIPALAVFCVSCPLFHNPGPSPYNEPDRLSWNNVNLPIIRTDTWQRFATDTGLFQLGDLVGDSRYTHTEVSFGDLRYEYRYHNSSYGTFPAIDGSTVLLPLAAEAGWQFLDLDDEEIPWFFGFSTTHHAYLKLIGAAGNNNTHGELWYNRGQVRRTVYYDIYRFGKQPDIIFATSPSEAELGIAKSRGIALTINPVCYDSFVFITHIDNAIDSLTVEQIRGIYSGQITNWSEVGGANEEITAFQREAGSGSQTAMEEMVMDGIEMMSAPSGWYVYGMGRLVEFIAEYQNAPGSIGYTFKYYVDRLYTNPNIKILMVNGIEPNDDNVRNKTYPFVAPYNGVIRSEDADNTGGRFLKWMLSEEGQKAVAQAGYVPVAR